MQLFVSHCLTLGDCPIIAHADHCKEVAIAAAGTSVDANGSTSAEATAKAGMQMLCTTKTNYLA